MVQRRIVTRGVFAVLTGFVLAQAARAGTADRLGAAGEFKERAVEVLKGAQSPDADKAREGKKALLALDEARKLLEEHEERRPENVARELQEVNSLIYWARKMMPLEISDLPEARPAEPSPGKSRDELAREYFERAQEYARRNSDGLFLIAVRFFEVADRFRGTHWSLEAQRLSLDYQRRLLAGQQTMPSPSTHEVAPVAGAGGTDHEAGKLPIPDAASLREAEKAVKDVFKEEYAKRAPTDREALARKLLERALETHDDAAARYVLLREARDVAAKAGDARTATRAVVEMAKLYTVDALDTKVRTLSTTRRAVRTVESARSLAQAYLGLADEAFASDNYTVAADAARTARSTALKAKDKALVDQASAKSKEIQSLKLEHQRTRMALTTLEKNPDDPAANTAVGRFLCLAKGDWDRGLPMLAKGSDRSLRALAERELARPAEPEAQAEVGDGWWALAQKKTGKKKRALLGRAGYWYGQAAPDLTGLLRVRVGKRLETIELSGARSSDWIDLLSRVDLARHRVSGDWTRRGGELFIEAPQASRVTIPVAPEGRYELEVKFTRTAGRGDVVTHIPVGPARAVLLLSGWGGGASGLDLINGAHADRNETTVRPGTLSNGHQYTIYIKVSPRGKEVAIAVDLDGKQYIRWKGPQAALSLMPWWTLPESGTPGLGAWLSTVVFHGARLRMITGKAQPLR